MLNANNIQNELGVPNQPIAEQTSAASFVEKLILGDPDKKKAQIKEKEANAEFTQALAQLASQMSIQQQEKKSLIGNTAFIIGAVVIIGGLIGAAIYINKKNKAAQAAIVS